MTDVMSDRDELERALALSAALMFECAQRGDFYEAKGRLWRRTQRAGLTPDLTGLSIAIECYRVAAQCHSLSIRAGMLCGRLIDRKRGDGLSIVESEIRRELDTSRGAVAD